VTMGLWINNGVHAIPAHNVFIACCFTTIPLLLRHWIRAAFYLDVPETAAWWKRKLLGDE